MPELPEVETTLRGIAPHLVGQLVTGVVIRQPALRWPVPEDLDVLLENSSLKRISRRAKYLLLHFDRGTLLIHLGMSGSLRILPSGMPHGKHDHVDIIFAHTLLRFHDPRRFGAVLWADANPLQHPLLRSLGPEPLCDQFNAEYLYSKAKQRYGPVKNLIMNSRVVVGVGNIYANEALFAAGIHPARSGNRISRKRYGRLVECIKQTLTSAIEQGGTTLQDFQQVDGKPGYFTQELCVYGRTNKPCPVCGLPIRQKQIGQRSTFYCNKCQR